MSQRPILDGDLDLCIDLVVAISGSRNNVWLARVYEFDPVDEKNIKVQYFDAITPTGTYYKLLPFTNESIHRDTIICNGIPMRPIQHMINGDYEWTWKVKE